MRVHFISLDAEREIAYFPDTKRYFIINETGKAMLADIQAGTAFEELEQRYSLSKEELADYAASIEQLGAMPAEPVSCDSPHDPARAAKILRRLVIHLSNDCNLRCVYCYANGGVYASDSCLLSTEMLEKILDVFFSEFDEISAVQFFGGEPLLNIDLLEYACKRIRELNAARGTETRFGIVINGTLISERFISLVKEYKIGVTVSYDGDPLVNDRLRVYPNGQGATETILKKTKWLREETGEPGTIEVTYTRYHIEQGVSILDAVRHIQEELPGIGVHLVPAGGQEGADYTVQDRNIFADSVREICSNYRQQPETQVLSYSLADRIFAALLHKDAPASRYICDAGFGTISVSVHGDVYPCFMFTDNDSLKLGNVAEPGLFQSERYREITKKIFEFSDKLANPKCKDCFINTLCSGCLGLNSFASGDPLLLSDEVCDMFRRMTEEALIGLTQMYDEKNG